MQHEPPDRRWPTEVARALVLVAAILALLRLSVPQAFYIDHVQPMQGWRYHLILVIFNLEAQAGWIAAALLPLVAVDMRPGAPRGVALLAAILTGVMLLGVLENLVLWLPGVYDHVLDAALAGPPAVLALLDLALLPLSVMHWAGLLALILALCRVGQSRGVALAALAATLAVMALVLLRAEPGFSSATQGKGLALIVAALWLWLVLRRPGALPSGAQPWLAALMITLLLAEAVSILPQIISALQIHTLSGRATAIRAVLEAHHYGTALGDFPQTLLILLALHQVGWARGPSPRWVWPLALGVALGLVLPLVAQNMGGAGSFSAALDSLRTGASGPVAGALGLIGGALGMLVYPALALLAVWLVRQPLERRAA